MSFVEIRYFIIDCCLKPQIRPALSNLTCRSRKAEHDLPQNLRKAKSIDETTPKQKHVRSNDNKDIIRYSMVKTV
ncbi:724_t:CDS:2 [Ambispora leptoticha]|uniref:724_t:CDS:1 n=1 Tax=Ambispora leptoticha TaxID=144679 RepID=A0A9N8VJH4_9GLOM|nr:724_t:CDS:2 [Ambispora leptoticha]